jgi:hypothetical protein
MKGLGMYTFTGSFSNFSFRVRPTEPGKETIMPGLTRSQEWQIMRNDEEES